MHTLHLQLLSFYFHLRVWSRTAPMLLRSIASLLYQSTQCMVGNVHCMKQVQFSKMCRTSQNLNDFTFKFYLQIHCIQFNVNRKMNVFKKHVHLNLFMHNSAELPLTSIHHWRATGTRTIPRCPKSLTSEEEFFSHQTPLHLRACWLPKASPASPFLKVNRWSFKASLNISHTDFLPL